MWLLSLFLPTQFAKWSEKSFTASIELKIMCLCLSGPCYWTSITAKVKNPLFFPCCVKYSGVVTRSSNCILTCILAVDQFPIDKDNFSFLKLSFYSLGWDILSLLTLPPPAKFEHIYVSGLTESPSVFYNQTYFLNLTCVCGDWEVTGVQALLI